MPFQFELQEQRRRLGGYLPQWHPLATNQPLAGCIVDHVSHPIVENQADTQPTRHPLHRVSCLILKSDNKLFENQITSTTCQILTTETWSQSSRLFLSSFSMISNKIVFICVSHAWSPWFPHTFPIAHCDLMGSARMAKMLGIYSISEDFFVCVCFIGMLYRSFSLWKLRRGALPWSFHQSVKRMKCCSDQYFVLYRTENTEHDCSKLLIC